MDGRTGNGRLRPSAVLGDLVRAAVPPLLPAGLAAAAACAAFSAGAATGTPVSPVLPVLALAALGLGAPVAVASALLVGAAALAGRRADPAGVRRRAVRAAPAVLLWAALLASPAAAALFLDPAPWPTAAVAAALLPLLPALLFTVPVAVVTGRPPHRVLPATLTPRGLRALLSGLRSQVTVPEHTGARPPIAAPIPVALLLGTVVVSGAAWGAAGPDAQAPTGPQTVHIEASDGAEQRFAVDLAVPDRDARAGARIGDHQVDAYWRTGPAERVPTLYLRVCPVADSCEDDTPGTLDVTATGPDSMRLVVLSCAEAGCPDTGQGGVPGGPDPEPEPADPADAIGRHTTPAPDTGPAPGSADPSCTPPACTPHA
ncbi:MULTISPECIES: hypothetical protein [unclassified Nocardiopsis]|uniref:hypothetical protein n=1 Tax=Nocardiopsis TaxID=2013 RepID=UPI00387B4AB5